MKSNWSVFVTCVPVYWCLLWIEPCPPHSTFIYWSLTSCCDSIWWWAFGSNQSEIKVGGWGPHDGIGGLSEETWEKDLSLSVSLGAQREGHVATQRESAHLQGARKRVLSPQKLNPVQPCSWESQSPGLWEINLYGLGHLVYSIRLWQPKQTKTVSQLRNCGLIQGHGDWLLCFTATGFHTYLSYLHGHGIFHVH